MKKSIKIENMTEWMTLYTILSNKERELENAIKEHENGTKTLFSVHECGCMLESVKNLLERM